MSVNFKKFWGQGVIFENQLWSLFKIKNVHILSKEAYGAGGARARGGY